MAAYISVRLRRQIEQDAGHRCGYCLSSTRITGTPLDAEHILPTARGGKTTRENLWLACHRCNRFKSDRINAADPLTGELTPLFNPRTQIWHEHFRWSRDGTEILGLTAIGRATIVTLQMNNEYVVESRRYWVIAGWHPPLD